MAYELKYIEELLYEIRESGIPTTNEDAYLSDFSVTDDGSEFSWGTVFQEFVADKLNDQQIIEENSRAATAAGLRWELVLLLVSGNKITKYLVEQVLSLAVLENSDFMRRDDTTVDGQWNGMPTCLREVYETLLQQHATITWKEKESANAN